MSNQHPGLESMSVRDIIDRHATETPDKIFLIDPENKQSLTYARLQSLCQAFNAKLAAFVPAGSSVAYAMNNSINLVKVICGLLYGGRQAVAVNLVSGHSTISYVLEHSKASLVMTDQHTSSQIAKVMASVELQTRTEQIDDEWFTRPAEGSPTKEKENIPTSQTDGLLMYTSGTTGVPKGVVHTHQSLLAGGNNTVIAHQLGKNDCGLCVLPLYHINAFCVSLMSTLVVGCTLVLPMKFSVKKFWNMTREHQCTWFSVVPTQMSYLCHEAEANDFDRSGLEALRFGRSASAPLAPEVLRNFESRFGVPIIETMGLTEAAAQILSNPMQGERKIGSPGIAFGNEVIVADDKQQEVARGTEGEVLVRGPNIMRLYLHNPEATREAVTDKGWFRTGDLARMDEDGYVFITGRIKELIIKGGENIAPREIDEALYTHADVVEAAAFARECSRYGQTVEAAVMLCEGSQLTESDLKNLCQQKVGDFKAPERIHFLPELPKGPSGKIQRNKLADIIS